MANGFAWLPPLVLFNEYGGDWARYVEALYAYFKADFVDGQPTYRGRRLGLKRHPLSQGKEATFWHMTSEGSTESDRVPDFRRCERIRWPRPIIEHPDETGIKVWTTVKQKEDRVHIWLEAANFVVVLADRGSYLLPWTAYYIDRDHQRRKLQREFEEFQKNQGQKC